MSGATFYCVSGENLDGKLTIDRFLEFQEELQRAILALEFTRKDPNEENLITEKQFAELILVINLNQVFIFLELNV